MEGRFANRRPIVGAPLPRRARAACRAGAGRRARTCSGTPDLWPTAHRLVRRVDFCHLSRGTTGCGRLVAREVRMMYSRESTPGGLDRLLARAGLDTQDGVRISRHPPSVSVAGSIAGRSALAAARRHWSAAALDRSTGVASP